MQIQINEHRLLDELDDRPLGCPFLPAWQDLGLHAQQRLLSWTYTPAQRYGDTDRFTSPKSDEPAKAASSSCRSHHGAALTELPLWVYLQSRLTRSGYPTLLPWNELSHLVTPGSHPSRKGKRSPRLRGRWRRQAAAKLAADPGRRRAQTLAAHCQMPASPLSPLQPPAGRCCFGRSPARSRSKSVAERGRRDVRWFVEAEASPVAQSGESFWAGAEVRRRGS